METGDILEDYRQKILELEQKIDSLKVSVEMQLAHNQILIYSLVCLDRETFLKVKDTAVFLMKRMLLKSDMREDACEQACKELIVSLDTVYGNVSKEQKQEIFK